MPALAADIVAYGPWAYDEKYWKAYEKFAQGENRLFPKQLATLTQSSLGDLLMSLVGGVVVAQCRIHMAFTKDELHDTDKSFAMDVDEVGYDSDGGGSDDGKHAEDGKHADEAKPAELRESLYRPTRACIIGQKLDPLWDKVGLGVPRCDRIALGGRFAACSA